MTTTLRDASGDLVIPRVIVTDFASVVRQTILDGLALFRGEWFLDQSTGFPWFQTVFGPKLTSTRNIDRVLRQFLLSVPGVATVVSSSTYNGAARLFTYVFEAFLTNSQSIQGDSQGPTLTITGAP